METKNVLNVLSDFRDDKLSLDDLSEWVSLNESLATQVLSRSDYLALKYSKLPNVYQVGAAKLKQCNNCASLIEKKMISDISEYWVINDKLKRKQESKIIRIIDKPIWYKIPKNRIGADSYYKCNTCGSIWALFMPERVNKGGFTRVM